MVRKARNGHHIAWRGLFLKAQSAVFKAVSRTSAVTTYWMVSTFNGRSESLIMLRIGTEELRYMSIIAGVIGGWDSDEALGT